MILARSLERPRNEVEGLLARAQRVSQKHGTAHQQLISAYQHAWTAFWYFEDFDEFIPLYSVVESLAQGSKNIYHVELLSNTWQLLTVVFQHGQIDKSQLDPRTDAFLAELDRFAGEDSPSSAALQARSMRLMAELIRTEANDPDLIFRDLKAVVEQCEHFIGYPLAPLIEILTAIGSRFGNSAGFDDLFLTIEEVWARREGDLAAAQVQLSRGAQQLDADRPLQAIRTLGRSLTRLFKNESKNELVKALYLCSSAYERIGLLWAARGSAISAAALATDESGNTKMSRDCRQPAIIG